MCRDQSALLAFPGLPFSGGVAAGALRSSRWASRVPHDYQTEGSLLSSYRKGKFFISGPFSSSDFWPTRPQPCLPTLRCSLGYLGCPGILQHSKIPPSAVDNVSILARCSVNFLCTLWPSLFQLRECFLPADLRHSPVNFLSRRGWFVLALISTWCSATDGISSHPSFDSLAGLSPLLWGI